MSQGNNTKDISLMASQLAMARTNAALGASHLNEVRQLSLIGGGIEVRPLHLAKYHFDEAAKLIDQALGKEPMPAIPSIADYITEARKVGSIAPRGPLPDNGCNVTLPPSAQDAPAASSTLSPSPEAEKENMGSDSADAGEGDSQSNTNPNPVNPLSQP